MNKVCYGCGATLQDVDTQKPGYISNLKNEDHMLCHRCFRMKNYNDYHSHYLDANHFYELVSKTIKKGNLVVLVIDLFDINSTLNIKIANLLKNNPLLIVGSKRDLILKSVKDKKIIAYLKKEAKKLNLNVKDIILSSANKKYGIDELLDSIFEYYNHKDVYIVGTTNVGKSSIVNAMINSIEKSDYQITISNYPGTTLDTIKIQLEDDVYLCDTPGLVEEAQVIHDVDLKDYKYLQTKNEIKSRIYQLEELQSIYIGGLVCFSYLSGEKTGFNFFINNPLKLHRTKYENRIELYDNHKEDDLLYPKSLSINEYQDFKVYKFDFTNEKKKKDIVILGLGWITFEPNNQVIEIAVSKNAKVIVRDALI
ncbi:ribosome biogenesis GTPase YqeH [Bacilli bacterium PM5-3]|nr:ribosome biogenesis GTPase YqeH [Bacilli bacterium PM5-3]